MGARSGPTVQRCWLFHRRRIGIDTANSYATLRTAEAWFVACLLVFSRQSQCSDEGGQGYSHLARFCDRRVDTPVGGYRSLPGRQVGQAIQVIDAADDFAQEQKFVVLELVPVEHRRPQRLPGEAGYFGWSRPVGVYFGHQPSDHKPQRASYGSGAGLTAPGGMVDSLFLPALST